MELNVLLQGGYQRVPGWFCADGESSFPRGRPRLQSVGECDRGGDQTYDKVSTEQNYHISATDNLKVLRI